MSQLMHGHESINANNFRAYNQDSFNVGIVAQLIETPFFQKLEQATKLQILQSYKKMLLSKSHIDHDVFNRKAQLASNYRLLKKLKNHFLTLNEITSAEELAPFISKFTPNYLSQSSCYEWTNQIKAEINALNAHRLDGVWSRGFSKSILDFKGIIWPKFIDLDAQVDILNGISSYILYFVRGGLDFFKLIKHSFSKNSFYKTHQISFLDKLQVQWELRYSQIINDICLWGPVNAKTYHDWRDARGDLLTAFLLIADLLHSVYIYFKTSRFFDKALEKFTQKDVQDQLKQSFKSTLQKQLWFMAYQVLLILAFSGVCGFFFFNFTSLELLSFNLYGSLVCFIIQILVNLIDLAFELQAAQNSIDTKIACFRIFTRVMVQLTIPTLFIASAYLLPLLQIQIPNLLVAALLLVFASLLVKLVNDMNQIFEIYMNPSLLDNSKQNKALDAILIRKDYFKTPELHQELNSLIDEWVVFYETSHQKQNAYNQLSSDLWLTGAFISASVTLCMMVSGGLAVNLVIPVLFALFCLSMTIAQPKIEKDPKVELSKQLGFAI